MPDYRLLALDIDGTLLDSSGQIRQDTCEAVARLQRSGIDVMLVTGRHHIMARPFQHQLALQSAAICCNGAYVYDYASDQPVAHAALAPAQAAQLLRWASEHELDLLLYIDDALLTAQLNAHVLGLQTWADQLPVALRPAIRLVSAGFAQELALATHIWKVVVAHADTTVLTQALQSLPLADKLSAEWSWHNRIDIVRAGNSKGARLAGYAASRGISADQVVAVGDHQNDISMLSWAGCGVAMGNASDAVKASARRVTASNDEGGIAQLINHLLSGVS